MCLLFFSFSGINYFKEVVLCGHAQRILPGVFFLSCFWARSGPDAAVVEGGEERWVFAIYTCASFGFPTAQLIHTNVPTSRLIVYCAPVVEQSLP